MRFCLSLIRIIRKYLVAEQSPACYIRLGVIRFIRFILQAVEGGERRDGLMFRRFSGWLLHSLTENSPTAYCEQLYEPDQLSK